MEKIEQPKTKQKEFDNKPPKPLVTVPKTPSADVKWMEIQNKDGKIKVEINKFLVEMVKKLKPEKVEAIIEQLQNALKQIKENQQKNKPSLGESFKDLLGKSYIVIGKDNITNKAILRRGNSQFIIDLNELYEKNGSKKNINNKILEESEMVVSF